jgi:hypothetical protein
MLYSRDELENRATLYFAKHQIDRIESLGFGAQGIVYSTTRESAIKIHGREAGYQRERDVYFRLSEFNVTDVRGLAVPALMQFDDALWILELGFVTPPYVLDFGAAYLDELLDFGEDPHDGEEREKEYRDMFGARWPEVQKVIRAFQSHGIYITDIHPGNIRFRE